jgi:hypothetical protein
MVTLRVLVARHWLTVACVLLGLALANCTAQFLSNYDEVFDKQVSDCQTKVDAFLLKLQNTSSPLRKYSAAAPNYDDVLSDIGALRTRAQANNSQSLNSETIGQIEKLKENVVLLQAQHQKTPNGPNVAFVRSAQDNIDIQFESILRLEIAKKRKPPGT